MIILNEDGILLSLDLTEVRNNIIGKTWFGALASNFNFSTSMIMLINIIIVVIYYHYTNFRIRQMGNVVRRRHTEINSVISEIIRLNNMNIAMTGNLVNVNQQNNNAQNNNPNANINDAANAYQNQNRENNNDNTNNNIDQANEGRGNEINTLNNNLNNNNTNVNNNNYDSNQNSNNNNIAFSNFNYLHDYVFDDEDENFVINNIERLHSSSMNLNNIRNNPNLNHNDEANSRANNPNAANNIPSCHMEEVHQTSNSTNNIPFEVNQMRNGHDQNNILDEEENKRVENSNFNFQVNNSDGIFNSNLVNNITPDNLNQDKYEIKEITSIESFASTNNQNNFNEYTSSLMKNLNMSDPPQERNGDLINFEPDDKPLNTAVMHKFVKTLDSSNKLITELDGKDQSQNNEPEIINYNSPEFILRRNLTLIHRDDTKYNETEKYINVNNTSNSENKTQNMDLDKDKVDNK